MELSRRSRWVRVWLVRKILPMFWQSSGAIRFPPKNNSLRFSLNFMAATVVTQNYIKYFTTVISLNMNTPLPVKLFPSKCRIRSVQLALTARSIEVKACSSRAHCLTSTISMKETCCKTSNKISPANNSTIVVLTLRVLVQWIHYWMVTNVWHQIISANRKSQHTHTPTC